MPPMKHSSFPIKSERRINPSQDTGTELENRLIIVYGVLQSKAESAADSFRRDQATLDSHFECAHDLQASSCVSNSPEKSRIVKIILISI